MAGSLIGLDDLGAVDEGGGRVVRTPTVHELLTTVATSSMRSHEADSAAFEADEVDDDEDEDDEDDAAVVTSAGGRWL